MDNKYINNLNIHNNSNENFDFQYLNDNELISNKGQSETSTKEINDSSDNKIVIESREDYINILRNEKEELLNSLNEKTITLEKLSDENQELKMSILQKEKDLININNENSKFKLQIEQMKIKNEQLQLNYDKCEKEKKNLKFQNIELNQKIESLNSSYKILEKIQYEHSDNLKQSIFKDEITKLKSQYDQNLIETAKHQYEKKSFEIKIKNILKEKENEILSINDLHEEEIEKMKKTITLLQNQIKELYQNTNQKLIIKQIDTKKNNMLNNKLKEYEKKIKKINEDNLQLKKENDGLFSKCEEMNLENEKKDQVIEKLYNDLQIIINKLNNEKQNENLLIQNQININEYNNKLYYLVNENKKLSKEVQNYAKNFQKFNLDINEANKLFFERNVGFKRKVLEYKEKIITLKTKINELYAEIDYLKQNKNYI